MYILVLTGRGTAVGVASHDHLGILGIDEGIVDGYNLHVRVALRCPEHQAPDAAKAIDAHLLQAYKVSTWSQTGGNVPILP